MDTLITQDPDILNGKPVIAGTRISVETILELLASGMTQPQIVAEYPFLTLAQVEGAVRYAASVMKKDETLIFDKLAHAK